MSFVIKKGAKYFQRRYRLDGSGPEWGPVATAYRFLTKRQAESHARIGERAVPDPTEVPIVARDAFDITFERVTGRPMRGRSGTAKTNPRGDYTMVLVRDKTPLAAYETETSSWDWITAAGIFRDSGIKVQTTDRIGFLKGRWTRRGAPAGGGWSFIPAKGQGVDAVRVPYAIYTPDKHEVRQAAWGLKGRTSGNPGEQNGVPRAYIAAALWSSTDDNGSPLDEHDGALAPATLKRMAADCQAFYSANLDLIEEAIEETGNTEDQMWHDLWLTANGHGAGFWDGDWKEYGDRLTKAAKKVKSMDLYVGDDRLIHG